MKLPGLENAKTAEALGSENAILKQRLADLQKELVDVNREKTQFGDRLRAAEAAMADAGVPAPVHDAGGPDTVVASPAETATGGASLAPLASLGSGGGASVRAGGLAPIGGSGGGKEAVCAKCGGGVSDVAVSSAAAGGGGGGSGGGAADVAGLQGKLQIVEAELQAKQAEIAALQEQMEMRINQTPQFKSLNQVGSVGMHATPATHEDNWPIPCHPPPVFPLML